MINNNF